MLPCVIEVIVIACVSRPLLDLPWNWAFLLGFVLPFSDDVTGGQFNAHFPRFVIAGVSPAVVIPSMLSLIDRGYGASSGIPTLLMAAATADNAFTITGFSVVLTLVFPAADSHLAMVICKGPLEVVIGVVCGVILGKVLSYIPPPSPSQAHLQALLLTLVGFSCVFGLKRATFAGAGVLAALVMATVAAQSWITKVSCLILYLNRGLKVVIYLLNFFQAEIAGLLQRAWIIGETLLFTLVGAQVEFSLLNFKIVGYGLVCLLVGVSLRCLVALLSVHCSTLNIKEKLFVCASWTPKATVQVMLTCHGDHVL